MLAGSIRDDGPLPGVFSDALAAQDAMREHTVRATGAIFIATALHAIAVGNMLPAYHTHYAGVPTPLMTICVDQTEFVVQQAQGPRHPPGLRRGHQRPGLHARAALLRRERHRFVILNQPGSGWARLAGQVAAELPVTEIDGVWQFRTIRREGREWGTAMLTRVDGAEQERRRIYTARFMHTLKGKERGKFEASLEEVGSGPVETLDDLLAGVRKRLEDEDPRAGPRHGLVPGDGWRASRRAEGAALLERFRRYLRDHRQPVTRPARPRRPGGAPLRRASLGRSDPTPAPARMGATVGLATIYRTLELLVQSGLVRAHDFGEGFRRYEPMPSQARARSPHLPALRPGGGVPERAAGADAADDRRRARLPHQRHRVEIYGICRDVASGGRFGSMSVAWLWWPSVAGLLSFLSPCVLPLVPSYIGFLTGMTLEEMTARRRVAFTHALLFVLGFSLVFLLLGASATRPGPRPGVPQGLAAAHRRGAHHPVRAGTAWGSSSSAVLMQDSGFTCRTSRWAIWGRCWWGWRSPPGGRPASGPILGGIFTLASASRDLRPGDAAAGRLLRRAWRCRSCSRPGRWSGSSTGSSGSGGTCRG